MSFNPHKMIQENTNTFSFHISDSKLFNGYDTGDKTEIPGLGVKNLRIGFRLPDRHVEVIENLSVSFSKNKITGIIGESGSGKSVLGMAMLGILPPYAEVSGDFFFEEKRYGYQSKEQKALLGRDLGFIPQSPEEALNPSRKIKKQLYEALAVKYKGRDIPGRAEDILRKMGFSNPKKICNSYPYELSGGMQQRALSAISVCCEPKWIIADEPTKGLDHALCARTAETLIQLKEFGVEGMIVITHDIHLAETICDEILVMYGGRILERGNQVLSSPRHPYTRALLESMPDRSMKPIPEPDSDYKTDSGILSPCPFFPRCTERSSRCMNERLWSSESGVECVLYE